jgi:PII-like signaling protein
VDTADKVEAFLTAVDELLTEGLVTMERVEVRAYRARPPQP